MKKNGFTHDNVDNLSVDWYTPPHIFDGLGVSGGNGAGSGSMLIAWGRENVQALLGIQSKGYLVVNNRGVKYEPNSTT